MSEGKDKIKSDINLFLDNLKKNLVDIKSYLILIPITIVLFLFKNKIFNLFIYFLAGIPAIFKGIIFEPKKYSIVFVSILCLFFVVLTTYNYTTGKDLDYYISKLNLI
tara:strand:- start:158 stop:481 length:324 start_codon:yes stop_codon:yes gene_type:complete